MTTGSQKPAPDAAAAPLRRVDAPTTAAAIVFGLFYAYALWSALSRLIDVPAAFADLGLDGVPWGWAVAALFVPIIVFGVAFWLGLRRRIGDKALLYLAGLAVVAALGFTFVSLENAALAAGLAATGVVE